MLGLSGYQEEKWWWGLESGRPTLRRCFGWSAAHTRSVWRWDSCGDWLLPLSLAIHLPLAKGNPQFCAKPADAGNDESSATQIPNHRLPNPRKTKALLNSALSPTYLTVLFVPNSSRSCGVSSCAMSWCIVFFGGQKVSVQPPGLLALAFFQGTMPMGTRPAVNRL